MKITQLKGPLKRESQQIVKLSVLMEKMKTESEGQPVTILRHSLQYVSRSVHCMSMNHCTGRHRVLLVCH